MKFTYLALILLGLTASAARAEDVPELKAIEARYDQTKLASDESLRVKYIMELITLRFHLSHRDLAGWQEVDAEMARHPAPATSDPKALHKLRTGIWYSPRHAYLFKANGTWVMGLDHDPDATHGTWSIKGNQYSDSISDQPSTYTIILATADNFIYSEPTPERTVVFYERRTETGGLPIMRDDPAP